MMAKRLNDNRVAIEWLIPRFMLDMKPRNTRVVLAIVRHHSF
jgi:hypothetical protein